MKLPNRGKSRSKGNALSTSAKVYSAESPMRHPNRFVVESVQDLMASNTFARRLFRQSIAQRYRYSSLGLLWAFAPPIVTAILLALSKRNTTSPASAADAQFYAIFGLMMAQTFLETFYTQRTIFSSNRTLLSRQRTTVEALVLAGLYDNLFGLAIRAAILGCFMIGNHAVPASTVPLGVLGLGIIFLLGSGLGLAFAPLSAIKGDIDKILAFLPWLIFALTPVFAPPVAGSGTSRVYEANPFTWLFDAVRAYTFGHSNVSGSILAMFGEVTLCMFPAALLYCRIARPHVAERLLD